MRGKLDDLSGKTFGRWTVLSLANDKPSGHGKQWLCECSCGSVKVVGASNLRDGRSRGCQKCGAKNAARGGDPASRRCHLCKERKPLEDFISDGRDPRGRGYRCKVCDLVYRRRSYLKKRYSLSGDGYEALLEFQGGVCAICSRSETGVQRLAVDHCHDNGLIRGLLCFACNVGIGKFADDVTLLEKAADYLRRNRSDASAPTMLSAVETD